MQINLSSNEREFLKLIIENSRQPDSEIAKKLNISTQAVGKIRKKLENNGVIKKYCCDLDFKKMGIDIFALIFLKIKIKAWEDFGSEKAFMESLKKLPGVLLSFFPSNSNIDLVTLRGFRSSEELDKFIRLAKSAYNQHFDIVETYIFSEYSLINYGSQSLFKMLLDNKEIRPPEIVEWVKRFKKHQNL